MDSINKEISFIHIPKTGGKSLIELFKKCGVTYKYSLHKSLNELWDIGNKDCFNITIVRHPYDRVLSFYNYFESIRNQSLNFDDYIENIDKVSYLIKPCYDFCTVNNELKIDLILKLENLNQDLEIHKKKLGLSFDEVPHINKTDLNFVDEFNSKHKNKIYKIFKKDFQNFSYEP